MHKYIANHMHSQPAIYARAASAQHWFNLQRVKLAQFVLGSEATAQIVTVALAS